jgi:replicative DNA helicase
MQEDLPLPSSIETERALLGALFLDDRLFSQVADLDVSAFHLDSHRRIYSAICALVDAGRKADLLTVTDRLRARKEIEAVGGVAYISSLTEGLPRRLNIEEYAAILKDKAQLRRVIALAEHAKTRALDQSESAEMVLLGLQTGVDSAVTEATPRAAEPIDIWAAKKFPQPADFIDRHKQNPGIPWGFKELDDLTSGMNAGHLVVVAARPGMGKTAAGLNVCHHVSVRLSYTSLFFSMEMPTEDLLDRLVCLRAGVAIKRVQNGWLTAVERRYCEEAYADLSEKLLLVDDTPVQTVPQMYAKAARVKQENGLDLVVVDYLQLIDGVKENKRGTRQEEVAGVSRALKAMARRLKVPVLVLAQLSRENEKRSDKKPILSDLRESGAIEQDADVVVFIHRPEYYDRSAENAGLAELIVAKQRQGALGTAKLRYREATTRFYDEGD